MAFSFFIFFIISIVIAIILTFSSKHLSPVPYFPTNKIDLPLIIKALNLKNNQIVFDLGAGDGIVLFEAANKAYQKKLNTKFIAIDINPILILIILLRRFFHPNKNNIKVIWNDFFKINFSSFSTNFKLQTIFYLYISPWFLDNVSKRILKEFPKVRIVSYMYPIKSLQKKPHFAKALRGKEKIIRGKNSIFVYDF